MTEQITLDQSSAGEGRLPQSGAVMAQADSRSNTPASPNPASSTSPQLAVASEPAPPAASGDQPASGDFKDESPWATAEASDPPASVSWIASEFIAHHKSPQWYIALAVGAFLGAFLVWLFTKDKISAAVILFGLLMFGISAGRQPRQLQYQLDGSGLTIGAKYYSFEDFRSYAVVTEGAFSSIMFLPLKRFAPAVSIYFAPQDEAAIIDLLSNRLPSEDRGHDPIDRLMTRIRF